MKVYILLICLFFWIIAAILGVKIADYIFNKHHYGFEKKKRLD